MNTWNVYIAWIKEKHWDCAQSQQNKELKVEPIFLQKFIMFMCNSQKTLRANDLHFGMKTV